jgi:two-component sensor histidine kinase
LREFLSIVEDGLAGPTTDRQREYLSIARRNADSLAEMIEQLLRFSRVRLGSFRLDRRRVRLPEMLRDATLIRGSSHRDKQVRLCIHVEPATPEVYADPDRLLEAVRNLIDNSIKYSGSSVTITLEARVLDEHWVELVVRDDGQGMDPATQRNLFRRRYRGREARRSNPGGLGLGLSIVKEIVDLHGGEIAVRSVVGRGTELAVSLPRYDREEILRNEIGAVWHRTARSGRGFFFVRLGIDSFDGALPVPAEELCEEVREILRSAARHGSTLISECGLGKDVCLLLIGERSQAERRLREILWTLRDRLQLKLAVRVEWDPRPIWIHSADYRHPKEMATAILHHGCRPEDRTNGS